LETNRNYLGEQLIKNNIITREQLEEALAVQGERAQRGETAYLGNILLELGYCTDEELDPVYEYWQIRQNSRQN